MRTGPEAQFRTVARFLAERLHQLLAKKRHWGLDQLNDVSQPEASVVGSSASLQFTTFTPSQSLQKLSRFTCTSGREKFHTHKAVVQALKEESLSRLQASKKHRNVIAVVASDHLQVSTPQLADLVLFGWTRAKPTALLLRPSTLLLACSSHFPSFVTVIARPFLRHTLLYTQRNGYRKARREESRSLRGRYRSRQSRFVSPHNPLSGPRS